MMSSPLLILQLFRRPPACTLHGVGIRASAGADYWACGVTEGVGEERIDDLGEWGTGAIPGAVYLTVIGSFLILSRFEISNFSSVLSYVLPFCLLCTSDHLILFN